MLIIDNATITRKGLVVIYSKGPKGGDHGDGRTQVTEGEPVWNSSIISKSL